MGDDLKKTSGISDFRRITCLGDALCQLPLLEAHEPITDEYSL